MRTLLTFAVAALALGSAVSVRADSPSVAAAFAASTPTKYDGQATFQNTVRGVTRLVYYTFTMDTRFRVTSLSVNGKAIVAVDRDNPLPSLPFPKNGTVENFNLSLQAWDELSAPVGPGSVGPVIVHPTAAAVPAKVTTVGFEVTSTGDDVVIPEVPVGVTSGSGRDAGVGYAWSESLRKGDTVYVTLYPAALVRFMPVPEMTGPKGWSLEVYGGSASGPVKWNGQWGFWAYLDPNPQWGTGYWLRGPGGFAEFDSLDPNAPTEDPKDLPTEAVHDGGVEVVDLRNTWPKWRQVSSTIDGQFSAGSGYGRQPSHSGEAVAVRLDADARGVNVFYAGPAAKVVVREVDEYGAPTVDAQGQPREWLLGTEGKPFWDQLESNHSGFVPIETGRAVILVTPSQAESRYGAYHLLVEQAYDAKG